MRPGPCAHCGSPDRSRQCRWAWWLPYAEDWKKSGADAPCYCDDYSEGLQLDERRFRKQVAIVLVVLCLIVAAAIWGYERNKGVPQGCTPMWVTLIACRN